MLKNKVWLKTPADVARNWNSSRTGGFSAEMYFPQRALSGILSAMSYDLQFLTRFDELSRRFEAPIDTNRWDRPCFLIPLDLISDTPAVSGEVAPSIESMNVEPTHVTTAAVLPPSAAAHGRAKPSSFVRAPRSNTSLPGALPLPSPAAAAPSQQPATPSGAHQPLTEHSEVLSSDGTGSPDLFMIDAKGLSNIDKLDGGALGLSSNSGGTGGLSAIFASISAAVLHGKQVRPSLATVGVRFT